MAKLLFLAYLPTGELITKPSCDLNYVRSACVRHFIFHPEEAIVVFSISDGKPTYETTIYREQIRFTELQKAVAA